MKKKIKQTTTWELCPNCGHEVELINEMKIQKCPICEANIKPCSLCYDCVKCPLERLYRKINAIKKGFS